MSWDKGFDFRETSGYVTDPTNCTYCLDTDSYPTTRNSVTFGWSTAPSGGRDRSAYTGDSAKVAGLNFAGAVGGVFQVDLPATGDYVINVAMGDAASTQDGSTIHIKDNATTLFTLTKASLAVDHFDDASDVTRTSNTDWVTNQASVTKTFASTTLNVTLDTFVNAIIAHLFLSQVGGGGLSVAQERPIFDQQASGQFVGKIWQ